MPTNKNAQQRYKVLDSCFSDLHRNYTIDDLLEKVNDSLGDLYGIDVSLRQIRDDIKYMRDREGFDAPIEAIPYEGKKCIYRYANPDFSIYKSPLTPQEMSNLSSTIRMLSRFRDGAQNAWLEEVISSLEYRLGIKGKRENVVSFEQNEQLKGLQFLSELIDAAANHQPLNIDYRPYKGDETSTIIHPYHLKQYNNRWFLFGLEVAGQQQRLTNRALDRIVRFSKANVEFIPNTTTDFDTYFKDIVGVTIPHRHPDVVEVLLRFDLERLPYVVSKPIHWSQELVDEANGIVRIKVCPNRELESQVYAYGPQVEILEPQWLRKKIAENIEILRKKYSTVQNDCTEDM